MVLPSIDALCQQARLAIAQRDWEGARAAYLKALAIRADVADIHHGLATVCFQLKDLAAAVHHFKEVTRLDPHRAGAFINLGAVYNLLDRLDDAIAVLRKGIALDPQRAEAYYNLGLVYRRKNQTDLAVHAYKEALRHNPRLADAHYNLGNIHLDKEHYRQAYEAYQKALEARPDWEKARQGLARAAEALEQQELERIAQERQERQMEEAAAPAAAPKIDPRKMVDPEAHGQLLTALHKATIEADEVTHKFVEMTERVLEPAIHELSAVLIAQDVSLTSLDATMRHFEEALGGLRRMREDLSTHVARVRTLGDHLVAEAG